MDSYQPIYDAVRSRISNGDIGEAVKDALRSSGPSHYLQCALASFQSTLAQYERPSAVYRPTLSIDGDQYIALYGKDIQSGVAGCGPTPDAAMAAFDNAWHTKLPPAATGTKVVAS